MQATHDIFNKQGKLVLSGKSRTLVIKYKMALKVVREGFLEEVRFMLWSWLGLCPVCPELTSRPHTSVVSDLSCVSRG